MKKFFTTAIAALMAGTMAHAAQFTNASATPAPMPNPVQMADDDYGIGAPEAPQNVRVEEIVGEVLRFTQSPYDVNGQSLNEEKLFFRVYFDNELYTFTPSVYMKLSSETTEIPYRYVDNYDFVIYDNEQVVYIFESGYELVGVESVYHFADKTYVSERVNYSATDIREAAVAKPIVRSYYTSLDGRRVENPTKGIYIRTDVYKDGTQKSRKVAR